MARHRLAAGGGAQSTGGPPGAVASAVPAPQRGMPPFDTLRWMQSYSETWAAELDPVGIGGWLRARRLSALLETALRDSPFYRRRARGARTLSDLLPVTKGELMHQFDDWATDRRITRSGVESFIGDPNRVADAWLGRYLVWTSSGTSGVPGIFVQDGASLAAYDAIDALRLRGADPAQAALGAWGLGRTFAFVGAVGGHFAGHVSFERLRRIVPGMLASTTQVLSVLEPMTRLAERLQRMQPGVLITYPSCAAALAQMQMRGELRIAPAEVWLGGEQVSGMQRDLLVRAFGCKVRNAYGSSEFYSMAFECAHGQLHVNSDWVVLEAVDAQMRPVPAGVLSHCTLLTNLANATQPLLRYRLDDRIRFVAGPCRCGSAFAAIQVEGRADETLSLPGRGRRPVTILPLALETAIEEQAGVTQFQVLCRPGGRLELRLEACVADAPAASRRCRLAAAAFLEGHGVLRTALSFSAEAPLRHRASGKLPRVLNVADA